MKSPTLQHDFYTRPDTLCVARELLGKRLVVPSATGARVSGRIVEVEAYLGVEDRAAHSYGGRRTRRTETMFGRGGRAYVFFVYGMHHQFNVVTGPEGWPHVVLIRAVEPLEGVELMRERRSVSKERELTNGPGKLCRALGIDLTFDDEDLTTGRRIWLEEAGEIYRSNRSLRPAHRHRLRRRGRAQALALLGQRERVRQPAGGSRPPLRVLEVERLDRSSLSQRL